MLYTLLLKFTKTFTCELRCQTSLVARIASASNECLRRQSPFASPMSVPSNDWLKNRHLTGNTLSMSHPDQTITILFMKLGSVRKEHMCSERESRKMFFRFICRLYWHVPIRLFSPHPFYLSAFPNGLSSKDVLMFLSFPWHTSK